MLNFGDTFYLEDKEYVWLHSDGDTIYSAIVLGNEETKKVKDLEKPASKKGVAHNKILFCYVELSTEDYCDCSANLITVNKHSHTDYKVIRHTQKKINEKDLRAIKSEILQYSNLFRPALVDFMNSIPL